MSGSAGRGLKPQPAKGFSFCRPAWVGKCLHCGKTIGLKRLEALPWTPYCIDCREKIENGEIEDPVAAA